MLPFWKNVRVFSLSHVHSHYPIKKKYTSHNKMMELVAKLYSTNRQKDVGENFIIQAQMDLFALNLNSGCDNVVT